MKKDIKKYFEVLKNKFDAIIATDKGSKKYQFEEAIDWAENKLKNDWDEKLTLSEAKKVIEKQYQSIKLLLGILKQYRK